MGKYEGKTADEWEAIAEEAKRNRNKYDDSSIEWGLYENERIQARNKANIARDHSSSNTSSSGSTNSSNSTSATTNTSGATTSTTTNTTTSSRNTTSSGSTTSTLSGNTTSSNNATTVAGTSTGISQSSNYPSNNTGGLEVVSGVSSNTNTATVADAGSSNDYSPEAEAAVEPTIETSTEEQTVAVPEEAPATPEQPSGQYIYAPEGGGEFWGSADNDTLFGGAGHDIFIGGKDQGSDTFLNISASDVVYLSDVTFNDLSRINKDGDTVNIAFKNGNSVTIQSTDTVSGAVVLGDLTVHFTHQKA